MDKAWWMGNTSGTFTIKSAYSLIRGKKDEQEWAKKIWVKRLPLKIIFFLWRVRKGRRTIDDNLRRMKIQLVSRCYCCENKDVETMAHIFLIAPTALGCGSSLLIVHIFNMKEDTYIT